MYKKVLLPVFLILLLTGCEYFIFKELHKEEAQPVPPNIEEKWASDHARPGDVWKVYLMATDLDGDMKAVYCMIEQKGFGPYPVSSTPIKPEYHKELNGYIYFNTDGTGGGGNTLNPANLTLRVKIQDKAGNFSNEVFLPLSLDAQSTQISHPPGYFKENNLGPIVIRLQSKPDRNQ